jgi:hypothetical protein
MEVDDGGSQAAAAEAVERPDEDYVEFPPNGVGEQLSILRFTAISPPKRATIATGIGSVWCQQCTWRHPIEITAVIAEPRAMGAPSMRGLPSCH